MPRHKSAVKQLRSSKRKNAHNVSTRSRLRSLVTNVEEAAKGTNSEDLKAKLSTAIAELQRAGSRQIIHKNTASRKISRLMKRVNKSTAPKA